MIPYKMLFLHGLFAPELNIKKPQQVLSAGGCCMVWKETRFPGQVDCSVTLHDHNSSIVL